MTVTVSFQPVALAGVHASAEAPPAAAPQQANNGAPAAASTDGRLLFVDGKLGAVLVRIEDELEEERYRGAWFLEAAFGVFADDGTRIFSTLSDAVAWAERRVGSPLPR